MSFHKILTRKGRRNREPTCSTSIGCKSKNDLLYISIWCSCSSRISIKFYYGYLKLYYIYSIFYLQLQLITWYECWSLWFPMEQMQDRRISELDRGITYGAGRDQKTTGLGWVRQEPQAHRRLPHLLPFAWLRWAEKTNRSTISTDLL